MRRSPFVHQQTGALLLAFGGPRFIDEVKPFIEQVFSHRGLTPSVIDEVLSRYQRIGGKSPLYEITERQAKALKSQLLEEGHEIEVSVGMRHWHPFIHETLKMMEAGGIRKAVCLVLSPFVTRATAGGYYEAVEEAVTALEKKIEVHFVPSWHNNPLYIEALREKVKEGLAKFSPHRRSEVTILFTAHSLPKSLLKADPYREQIDSTISAITEGLPTKTWYLAFQSGRRGQEEWLSPAVDEVVMLFAKRGMRDILLVPLSFVAEHLETLYDLDILLRDKADALGLRLERVPSLNDDPLFIKALTAIILQVLTQHLW